MSFLLSQQWTVCETLSLRNAVTKKRSRTNSLSKLSQICLSELTTTLDAQPPRIKSSVSVVVDKIFPLGYKCTLCHTATKVPVLKQEENSSRLSSAVLSDALKTSICQMLDDAFEYYLLIKSFFLWLSNNIWLNMEHIYSIYRVFGIRSW